MDRLLEQDIERLTYHFNVNVFPYHPITRYFRHTNAEFGRIVLMNTAVLTVGEVKAPDTEWQKHYIVVFNIAKNFSQHNDHLPTSSLWIHCHST